MWKLRQAAIAASLLLACSASVSPESDRSAPSGPAARFATEGGNHSDVGAAQLQVRGAGTVSLPTGELAVSDVFVMDYPLIVSDLPPGEYCVEVLVAKSLADERVAAARVRISDEPVASWSRVGFIAIDSGTGAFFDPRIASSNPEGFSDDLLNALEASYRQTYSIAATSWHNLTLVAFSTGFGDGAYPVYLGSSAAGPPAAVLVDCEILPWPE